VFSIRESSILQHLFHDGSIWQIHNALGEVTISRAVTQKRTNLWDDLAEVNVVTESNDRIVRNADIKQCDSSTWPDDSGALDKELLQVDKISQCESTNDSVN
jgi:hypothetical protein